MFKAGTDRIRSALVTRVACVALAGLASLGLGTANAADNFPNKAVSLIVPYPAGGASDVSARIFSKPLAENLKQTVIVENIGGASGSIAANRMLNAPADGYYMFHGSPTELTLAPLTMEAVRYQPEDFRLVHPMTTGMMVVLTRGDLKADNMDDLINLARSTPSGLSYGSVGVGSLYQLLVEYIAKQGEMPVMHVPYRGGAPVIQDLVGGAIDFAVLPYQTSFKSLADEGRLKIIATIGDVTPPVLASYPNVTQSKLLAGKDLSSLTGLMAGYYVKKGTPDDVVDRLREALIYTTQQPSAIAPIELEGKVMSKPLSAQEVADLQKSQIERYRALVKFIDFKPM